MANSVELFGAGWGALTGLSIGFLALQAWRGRRHGARVQSTWENPAEQASPHRDTPLMTFESRELDVMQEVAGSLAQLRASAQHQQVEFQVSVQPRLAVWADPCALRQMLSGILAQAMERAVGGAVLLSAVWHGGRVQVTVMDDGPASDRAAMAGSLRQVEQCAALQGGTLEIECRSPHGNRVVLRMPGSGVPDVLETEDDVVEEPTVRDAPWSRVEDS
jgi:hypothetical protein